MSNSSNNNTGLFWVGLAVGATLGYLLNSDRGRELQVEAGTKAKQYGNQIKQTSQQQIDQLSNNVNSWIEQGQTYAKDIQSMTKDRIDTIASSAKSAVGSTENAFQRGANKAKANIEAQKNQVDSAIENGVA
ncbi:MAG: YtxH domain-containing protein [Bacteroidota bacterium]